MQCPLSSCSTLKTAPPLTWAVLESWPRWYGCQRAGSHWHTCRRVCQADQPGLDFELVHPNINPSMNCWSV